MQVHDVPTARTLVKAVDILCDQQRDVAEPLQFRKREVGDARNDRAQ